MKKIAVLSLMFSLLFPSIARAGAEAFVPREGKVIVIDQKNQDGWAYENGKLLLSFPILAGDDETPTGNGRYTVRKKIKNYFSNRYQVPMPYSLFFVFSSSSRKAVHEGEVPKRKNGPLTDAFTWRCAL